MYGSGARVNSVGRDHPPPPACRAARRCMADTRTEAGGWRHNIPRPGRWHHGHEADRAAALSARYSGCSCQRRPPNRRQNHCLTSCDLRREVPNPCGVTLQQSGRGRGPSKEKQARGRLRCAHNHLSDDRGCVVGASSITYSTKASLEEVLQLSAPICKPADSAGASKHANV